MTRAPHRWEEGKSPEVLELAAPPEWLEKKRSKRPRAEKLPPVIRDGTWHKTMVSAAGTMRRRGFSEEAATAALIAENGKYEGTLPLDSDGEIAELVADVYGRYQAVGSVSPDDPDTRTTSREPSPLSEKVVQVGDSDTTGQPPALALEPDILGRLRGTSDVPGLRESAGRRRSSTCAWRAGSCRGGAPRIAR